MAGDMYLENLDEFLFDEDRVVTYKWLSQTLSVHVNQAKRMLESYLDHLKGNAKLAAINATYLVSGVQEKDNGVRLNKVVVVASKDLEKTEASMVEVLSKHVYSIQKAVLKDSSTLYMTDYAVTKDSIKQPSRFSAIRCGQAKPRTAAELEELAAKAGASYSPSTDAGPAAKPRINGHAQGHATESSKPEPRKDAAPAPAPQAAASKGQRGQLTAFGGFSASNGGRSSAKSDETKDDEDDSRTKKEAQKSTQPTGKARGGMMAFLTSGAPAKAREASPPPAHPKGRAASLEKAPSVPSGNRRTSPAESKSQGKAGGKAKRKAARIDVSDSDSEDEKHSTKRRRRIIQPESSSSSSSSEEDVSDMEDSPIPPTPPPAPDQLNSSEDEKEEEVTKRSSHVRDEEETAVVTTTPGGKRRRRKRVLRNKTTIDDEGCMVTEKVWESDWTDEEEEAAPPPSKAATPRGPARSPSAPGGRAKTAAEEEEEGEEVEGKKKKASPGSGSGKTKQRTLMSFFKKK